MTGQSPGAIMSRFGREVLMCERFAPLFSDVAGLPTPVLPYDDDGNPRTPDGVLVFDLEQAVARFGKPAGMLRRQWDATWGSVLPPADAPAVASEAVAAVPADRLERLRRAMYPHLLEPEWQGFLDICHARQLNPWTRHLWPVVSTADNGDREIRIITTIDALRAIAHRSGQYGGIAYQQWCGPQLDWQDVWTGDAFPYAARVGVIRRGIEQPFPGVALWREYARATRTEQNELVIDPVWRQYPSRLLSKCAHALALREAIGECEGLYIDAEMQLIPPPTATTAPSPVEHQLQQPGGSRSTLTEDEIPQGWMSFNTFLVDWGLQNPAKREAVITKLRRELPGLLESDEPENFYRQAAIRVSRDPARYGAKVPVNA